MRPFARYAAGFGITAPLIALALLRTGPFLPAGEAAQEAARPVVLISIDGLRPDYVTEADRNGLKIPNLRRLLREGAHATGVVGVVPTVTYPSHATLVTGVAPARHGIHSNTTFDPLAKNQGGWYWYASDLVATALWDAAAEQGLTVANVHWPVTVAARITWNIPQYWRTGTPDDRKLVRALSTPKLLDELENDLGPYADGIDESIEGDERRARFVVRLVETRRPGLALAYFTALDHAQHEHGPFSAEARATLERIDRLVGQVWQAASEASGGRAVVCVVSDHGFERTDKALNLGVAFADAGLVTLGADGKPTKWLAIPWGAGASAAVVVADSANRTTRDRVRGVLDRLASQPSNGIDTILDAAALRAAGGFPQASYYVALRPGFTAGAALKGPLITPSTVRGMHGYLNSSPGMRASFFVAGPGIAAGQSLGEIDMRDVAPTLAAILGVRLPAAEGRDILRDATSRPVNRF